MYLVVGRSLGTSSFVSAVKKDVSENKKDFYHRGEKIVTYCKNLGGGRGGQRSHIRARLSYLRSEAQQLSLRPCPACNHHGGSDVFHMTLYHATIFLFFHISLSF